MGEPAHDVRPEDGVALPPPAHHYGDDLGLGDAGLIVATASSPQELAAVVARYPQYVVPIFQFIHRTFGNQVAELVARLVHGVETGTGMDHVAGAVDTAALTDAGTTDLTGGAVDHAAAVPGDRLPFADDGWDALTINRRLGQYDRMAGTNADASRCSQATAMAVHVLRGPAGTVAWLRAYKDENQARSKQAGPRVAAAAGVIDAVIAAIEARTATYGDLSWAQEALHDMFYADDSGSFGGASVLAGATDTWTQIALWCSTAKEVLTHVATLAEGEALMCVARTIAWNAEFYDQEIEGDSLTTDDGTRVKRQKLPRKKGKKPSPSDFQDARDHVSASHQVMIAKHQGQTYVYDSEVQVDGEHQRGFGGKDLAAIDHYLAPSPLEDEGFFNYLEIEGKVGKKVAPAGT